MHQPHEVCTCSTWHNLGLFSRMTHLPIRPWPSFGMTYPRVELVHDHATCRQLEMQPWTSVDLVESNIFECRHHLWMVCFTRIVSTSSDFKKKLPRFRWHVYDVSKKVRGAGLSLRPGWAFCVFLVWLCHGRCRPLAIACKLEAVIYCILAKYPTFDFCKNKKSKV